MGSLYRLFSRGSSTDLEPSTFSLARKAEEDRKVFSTFLARPIEGEQRVFLFERHLARLARDGSELELIDDCAEHNPDFLKRRVLESLIECRELLGFTPWRVRVLLSALGAELHVSPYIPRWQPGAEISLVSVTGERPQSNSKSNDISVCENAALIAQRLGAQEALLIDQADSVLEGAWSNIFWVDQSGTLNTTQYSMLPGVTRDWILEHYPCTLRSIQLNELLDSASEVFITQSTTGITGVRSLDGVTFDRKHSEPSHTSQLQLAYEKAWQEEGSSIDALLRGAK